MLSKNLFLVLAILAGLITVALAFCNMASVPVQFFSLHTDLPMAVVVAKSYILGVVTILCIWRMQRKETKIEQKKLEWKTEDAKLQTEIQSDKVHQLELQVKTLESALDKALKRGK